MNYTNLIIRQYSLGMLTCYVYSGMCLYGGAVRICGCNTFLIILNQRISYDIALVLAICSRYPSIYRWTPRSSRRTHRTWPRSTSGTGSGTAWSFECAACCGHAHSRADRSSGGRGRSAGRSDLRCPGCPSADSARSSWATPPGRSAPCASANRGPVSGHERCRHASFCKKLKVERGMC